MYKRIQHPFHEYDADVYFSRIREEISSEIKKQSNEYILGVDKQNYINYLIDKYSIVEIAIDFESADLSIVKKEEHRDERPYGSPLYGWPDIYTKYIFSISLKYIGNSDILQLYAANEFSFSIGGSGTISDIEVVGDTLNLTFPVFKRLSESDEDLKKDILKEKKGTIGQTFCNLEHTLSYIRKFNQSLPAYIERTFDDYKSTIEHEKSVFDSLGIKTHSTDSDKYVVPIYKKETPIPLFSTTGEVNPIISDNIYKSILTTIYNVYKGFERLPNNYRDRDEESLRDAVIPVLQNDYTSLSTSGETFNKEGKTDICIKSSNGNNVFIAECKIWKGEKMLLDAINQLFDRYLTMRDSKVALILFVKNNNFTEIWDKIQMTVAKHEYYTRSNGSSAKTSKSYIFHHPQDIKVDINLEVMAFHFPDKI